MKNKYTLRGALLVYRYSLDIFDWFYYQSDDHRFYEENVRADHLLQEQALEDPEFFEAYINKVNQLFP